MALFEISPQLRKAAERSLEAEPLKKGHLCAVYDLAVSGLALLVFENGEEFPLRDKEVVFPFTAKDGRRGYVLEKGRALEFMTEESS